MLASRAAENVFWAARYIERAEDTARIVAQHTDVLVDLPTSTALRWEPLLAITGTEASLPASDGNQELAIVSHLVSDSTNPSSIVGCVSAARENLRTTRELIPRDMWQTINDLYHYVSSRHDEGVRRASRSRFLRHVIGECQRSVGILSGTMSRDVAYAVMRLGRNLERADMTTRVLDVRAVSLLAETHTYDSIQWAGVLKSLSAFQMYRRSASEPISADGVVRFCLTDEAFPRSVSHCLIEAGRSLVSLPRSDAPTGLCTDSVKALAALDLHGLDGPSLHGLCDRLQSTIAEVTEACTAAYFRPQPVQQWQATQ
jgi:uncharacterized alpha-E superfamily protein